MLRGIICVAIALCGSCTQAVHVASPALSDTVEDGSSESTSSIASLGLEHFVHTRSLEQILGLNFGQGILGVLLAQLFGNVDLTLGLAGSSNVPSTADIIALFEDSLARIEGMVRDVITEAFLNDKKALAASLADKYPEYHRTNDPTANLVLVQLMLDDASELLNYFQISAPIASNRAFQAVLSMRLALLAEKRLLLIASGNSDAAIAHASSNIKGEAADGYDVLDNWRKTWVPAVAKVEYGDHNWIHGHRLVYFCVEVGGSGLDALPPPSCDACSGGWDGFGFHPDLYTCEFARTDDWKDPTCAYRPERSEHTCVFNECNANHFRPVIENRRTRRCRDKWHNNKKAEYQLDGDDNLLPDSPEVRRFRDARDKAVFGDGIDEYMQLLQQISGGNFDAVDELDVPTL